MLHGVIGAATEVGELLEAFAILGKVDDVNLAEELGDVLWYFAVICDEKGITFNGIQQAVINKLRKRYPEGFTEHDALNRDLDTERDQLETDLG